MASTRKAGAADLQVALAACLARYLRPGARLGVGYSGGLDSTVLLHALAHLPGLQRATLSAVHVHHGLSPFADAWAAHCQAFCQALGIPLELARVKVNPRGMGLEAAAREARYAVFRAQGVDALLLAQHQDDQAETVLLQLLRGASVRGLAAMPEARPLKPGTLLLRPFLAFTRDELEAYARAQGLDWVEDESNQDPSLARNHVRHTLLPGLEAAMPGLPLALARAAAQFAEWADLLDDLAELDAQGYTGTEGAQGLSLGRLRDLPEPRARNLLRHHVEQAGGQLGRKTLLEAVRQLRGATHVAQLRVDFGRCSVVCFRDHVQVVPKSVFAPVPQLERLWQGEIRVDLGAGGVLDLQPEAGEVALPPAARLRYRQAGDRMQLAAHQARRPLKDLMREAGIPPWQRPWLPVLALDGQVIWVAGLGPAHGFKAPDGWAISWQAAW